MRLSHAIAGALLAGCSGAHDDAPAPVYADAPHIEGSATEGTLDLSFSLDLSGQGTSRIGAIALNAGTGTAQLDGREARAAVVAQVPYAGEEVYQVLAVDAARWAVAWVYCSKGALSGAYLESTDAPGGVSSERVVGACASTPTATRVHVTFPAYDLPAPALPSASFAVAGDGLSYDGAHPGTIAVGGATLAMYPFGVVDCTRGCADIGWYELHSLLWDPVARRASFGVLYLYEDRNFPVELAYTMTLPSLTSYGDALAFPGAAWSKAP